MELNYVLCVVERSTGRGVAALCVEQGLPLALTALGRGTATQRHLDLYGLEPTEKALVVTVADAEKTRALFFELRKRFYIDIPGNGIALSIPIKSVGGEQTLAFLSGNAAVDKLPPKVSFENELIIAIANEGYSETVMDAARAAGARGGTVIHAKGTGGRKAEKFYGISLAEEKEIILIVAKTSEKAGIICNIVREAGPDRPAGSVVFSLPVSQVAGLGLREEPV